MKITSLDFISEEIIKLFYEQDDYMMDFLGADGVYYTRYSKTEKIKRVWLAYFRDGLYVEMEKKL